MFLLSREPDQEAALEAKLERVFVAMLYKSLQLEDMWHQLSSL